MSFDLKELEKLDTPFYYYDMGLLQRTIDEIKSCMAGMRCNLHYAVKANSNPAILRAIADAGFGADCVSGGEVMAALEAGFPAESISYAGVGKTDREIRLGIEAEIGCFNAESLEELEIIAGIARQCGKRARVAIRINPDIDAHTHHYITTGIAENKFGIDMGRLPSAIDLLLGNQDALDFVGLHFHIGSQITNMEPFRILCGRMLALQKQVEDAGLKVKALNVGGGLGIDYDDPDSNPVPDFKAYFDVFRRCLPLHADQEMHCELGRALVGQCGSLITRVIYVKTGVEKKFLIVDGGMSDLLRPALYGARHLAQNLSAQARGEKHTEKYDIVGPICETADTFSKDEAMPAALRGDLVAFRSAGAYGESMASNYNMRRLPGAYTAFC